MKTTQEVFEHFGCLVIASYKENAVKVGDVVDGALIDSELAAGHPALLPEGSMLVIVGPATEQDVIDHANFRGLDPLILPDSAFWKVAAE